MGFYLTAEHRVLHICELESKSFIVFNVLCKRKSKEMFAPEDKGNLAFCTACFASLKLDHMC